MRESGYMTSPSSEAYSDGQIDHTHFLVSNISNTYLSDSFWDVELVVDGEHLHAHRVILSLSSEYFRDFFYGGEEKPNKLDLVLSVTPLTIFKKLLKYIYTAQIQLSVLKGRDAFKFFEMSNYFRMSNLQSECPSSSGVVRKKQIDHTHFMVSEISKLYLSKSHSDVVLVVVGEELHAHRVVLASSSDYFRFLFFGGFRETHDEDVEINDVSVDYFKRLLKYIYTGQINLGEFEGREIFELLKISDYFRVSNLKISLHNYLQRSIELNDVCSFLTMTRLYKFKELELESLKFMDKNSLGVLQENDFQNLSPGALQDILNRDTFYAKELDIFNAVCRWIDKNQNEMDSYTKIKILSDVRYSLMSDEELSKAKKSKLVSSDIVSEAIQLSNIWSSDKPQVRAQLNPNWRFQFQSHSPPVTSENHIHKSKGFSVLNNNIGTNMIKLNDPSWINYIEITLVDKHGKAEPLSKLYSYYIKVSKDGRDWVRVIDHSNYNCRSFQRLWIHPQIVQFIHIVGTNSTVRAAFKLEDVRYNEKDMHMLEIKNGFVVPKHEDMFYTIFSNATVIEGENSIKDRSLLYYNYKVDTCNDKYPRQAIYTYHKLGTGCIVVRFTQPYILSSMSMILWGGNDQTYCYTVEASLDDREWVMLVNNSKKPSKSLQSLQFKPTPMLYIRITGVSSSTGDDFRCMYLRGSEDQRTDTSVIETSDQTRDV